MNFAVDPPNHFFLKELYRLRRQSLEAMVQDCYAKLLSDPALTILSDREIIDQHKVQSIQRIVQTLIDSESELMVAKLATEGQLLQSEVRMLKERLNRLTAEAQHHSERQSPEEYKRKLAMFQEEKHQQEEEFKAMLKEYGFEFVNSLQYSLQRVLKEHSFATRGVAMREELINRLYREMGRDNDKSSRMSTPPKAVNGGQSQTAEQLAAEIERLNGLVRTLTDSRESTCILLQRKLEDAEHKNTRDIKLLKENEFKLRQQVEQKLERLEQDNRQSHQRAVTFQREATLLREDCGLLRMQLEQTTANKHLFEARLKELQQMLEAVRTQCEASNAENNAIRKELENANASKRQLEVKIEDLSKIVDEGQKQLSNREEQLLKAKDEYDRDTRSLNQELERAKKEWETTMQIQISQNHELREKLVTVLSELELSQDRPSLKLIQSPAQPHEIVAEMERLCNERVASFERDLQQKNAEITALTKEKLHNLHIIEEAESKLSAYKKSSNVQESRALVDDIGMLVKTLEFERKLHEQKSLQLKKILANETSKLTKEVEQLKQLLNQKEATLKRFEIQRRQDCQPVGVYSISELKKQLGRLSAEFRALKQTVNRELRATSHLLQVAPQHVQEKPLQIHNQTKKLQRACIRRQSPPSSNELTRKLIGHERYLHRLNSMLDTSSSDEQ